MRWRREGPARARGAAFTFNATLNPSLALLAFSPQIDAKIASIITERTSAVQASDAFAMLHGENAMKTGNCAIVMLPCQLHIRPVVVGSNAVNDTSG